MKIWQTGMTTADAIGLLRQAGILSPDVNEGIVLTREFLENMTPEQKAKLIEYKEKVGAEQFRKVIYRAMGNEVAKGPLSGPNLKRPVITSLPPTERIKKQKPNQNRPQFDTQQFRKKHELDPKIPIAMPASTLGQDPENEAIRLVRERKKIEDREIDETATRPLTIVPKGRRDFKIDRTPTKQYSSWLDQFISEH